MNTSVPLYVRRALGPPDVFGTDVFEWELVVGSSNAMGWPGVATSNESNRPRSHSMGLPVRTADQLGWFGG